jgi:soluble cytochrome b562
MEWVIDPTVDVIWDSVKTIMTQSGTKEIKPETDEQWAAVRNAAATLTESGNMLLIEGRARDQTEWTSAARRLITTADQALKAAEARNVEALFNAGGEIYKACAACHQRYIPNFQAPPEQAGK